MKLERLNTVGAVPLTDVRGTLALMGLTPWAPKAIAAYMRREKSHYRPNFWYYFGKVLPYYRVRDSIPHLIKATAWAFVSFVLVAMAYLETPTATLWMLGGCSLVLTVALFVLAAVTIWMDYSMIYGWLADRKVLEPAVWNRLRVGEYTGVKPGAFGETMDKVRSVFPRASFAVSELKQDDRLLDPVLWAIVPTEDGVEEVAVLVWDAGGVVVPPR